MHRHEVCHHGQKSRPDLNISSLHSNAFMLHEKSMLFVFEVWKALFIWRNRQSGQISTIKLNLYDDAIICTF